MRAVSERCGSQDGEHQVLLLDDFERDVLACVLRRSSWEVDRRTELNAQVLLELQEHGLNTAAARDVIAQLRKAVLR
ncbi:MAG: hypothetical protein GWO02_05125 [Gammaproteobacteria bacterium]|nr:hypothetical protein [Gammaproteobacteria bacterium]